MSGNESKQYPGGSSSQLDDELAREVEQALGDQSIEQLMADAEAAEAQAAQTQHQDQPQDDPDARIEMEIRRGRISQIRGDDVFVELAGGIGKNQGVVPLKQFDRPPRLGSIMDFVVERTDEAEGLVHLSREGAVSTATWAQLTRGATVEARVVATNKGGLDMEMVGGIRAFMPASQIDLHHVKDLEAFVGEKLPAIVQEIDRKSKKVVLSRRKYLEHERERLKQKLWAQLEVDQIREGVVSSILEYGAFVDLGGADGLIHVSDLSYTHINKPEEVVKVGQKVRVKVLKLDEDKKRISLGLKQVEPDPWEGIENKLKVGEQITGRVLRTASFGAFVEVEPGVEGLLPISEMSWSRVNRAEDVVNSGDVVRLAVLAVDPDKRRVSLSLKQAKGDPWVGASVKYPRHAVVEGKVLSTTDFGAFVELEPGVEGLVHISELSDRRVDSVQDVVKVGDTTQFRVLDLDEDNHKLRLSIKALKEPEPRENVDNARPEPTKGKSAKRKPAKPGNLKGGMEGGGAMGLGLGDLRL